MTPWQIFIGTAPLIFTILGAAIHVGIRLGRFQEMLRVISKTQDELARDLALHESHDERLFSELNAALRLHADALNRLVGAVTGKAV